MITTYFEIFKDKTIFGHRKFLIKADFNMWYYGNTATEPTEKYNHYGRANPFLQ